MGGSLWRWGGGGHFSHDHHRAGFKRVDRSNASPATCGMCQLRVDVGTVVHRCKEPGCPYLLHDDCFQRPKKLKLPFAHTQHRVTLCAAAAAAEADHLPCSVCAQPLAAAVFAYRCTNNSCAVVFRAHPRCCDLPQDIVISKGHDHDMFVLRPPSASTGLRCVKCRKTATTGPAAPWSYHCLSCDKEVCLKCLRLGNSGADNDDGYTVRCCCSPGTVHCLGQVAGVFLCGLASGMGCPCPCSTAPTPIAWSPGHESSHNHNGK